jgi:precorrin-2 dehydrogenase/sirohydrochlorin ferrochelatase
MMNDEQHHPYYPLFLDIKHKKCAVIGGGTVALRKVNMLLDYGADVTVISPELCDELQLMVSKNKIRFVHREYQATDLNDAVLAIAATDDNEINSRVSRDAGNRHIPVNIVDAPQLSDFIVPSYLQRGDITIAVSTGGRSPALARKIRANLEKRFGSEYAVLARIIGEARSELKEKGIAVSGDDWQEAIELKKMLSMIAAGNEAELKRIILERLQFSDSA